MAETPEEKIRRLEEKIAKDAEAVRRPRQILYERNRLKAKVEKFSADIEKLTTSLEGLKSDRKGVMEAMVEVDVFLNKLGVEVRHRWPLFRLLWALEDLDYGIINPITDKSTRVGQPLPSQEVALKTWACLAGIGLCATGTKKGKAYDIVAEASGLPRGKLKLLNQTGKKGDRGPAMVLSNVSGHIDNFWNNAGDYVLDGKHFPGMPPEKLQTEVDEILNALRQMRDFDTKPVTAPKQ